MKKRISHVQLEGTQKFPVIVVGTSYVHPISQPDMVEVYKDCFENKYQGPILIDAMLANGLTASNRFVKSDFDYLEFDPENPTAQYFKDWEIVSNVNSKLTDISYTFFKENSVFIDNNATLPNAQIYLLKKGLLLGK